MRRRNGRLKVLVALLVVTPALFAVTPSQAAAPLFGPPVRLTPATAFGQQEPAIAINPTNARNLVAGSIDNGQCAVYFSTDRGATWTSSIMATAPGFTNAGDPVVDFAADGTAYYLCMNTAAGNSQLGQYVYRSSDGGQSWGNPVLAITRAVNDLDDKGDIVVDDRPTSPYLGNVYVAATRLNENPRRVHFARSTDQGASFISQQVISDSDTGFAVSLAVGADGAVYAAWSREAPPGSQVAIMIDKSTNGGASFGALTGGTDHTIQSGGIATNARPDPAGRGNGNPYIAAHPTDPNIVYAAWAENPPGVDDADIHFSRSTNGGNTWSTSVRLNTDVNPAGEFFSQYWPTMSVDPVTGDVDIIWYSDQHDPNRTDGTPLVDLYFTSSSNDGAGFSTPIRVTPASVTPAGFFGDYLGIDSFGGVAHPVWVDTTLGAGDPDIATTQIGGADLHITKTGPAGAAAGTTVTYTLDVTNGGPADAPDTTVTDTLPAGTTFVSATGGCTESPTGVVGCDLGTVPAGGSTTVDITVAVAADLVFNAAGAVTIVNQASVASSHGDPDPTDNQASAATTITAEADVAIVSAGFVTPPTEALVGESVAVTLRKQVTNGGPSAPVDVSVTGTVDAPAEVAVSPSAVTTTLSAVAAGELRQVDEAFTVTCDAPGSHAVTIDNSATPLGSSVHDPNPTNNAASTTLTIECVLPVAINVSNREAPSIRSTSGPRSSQSGSSPPRPASTACRRPSTPPPSTSPASAWAHRRLSTPVEVALRSTARATSRTCMNSTRSLATVIPTSSRTSRRPTPAPRARRQRCACAAHTPSPPRPTRSGGAT